MMNSSAFGWSSFVCSGCCPGDADENLPQQAAVYNLIQSMIDQIQHDNGGSDNEDRLDMRLMVREWDRLLSAHVQVRSGCVCVLTLCGEHSLIMEAVWRVHFGLRVHVERTLSRCTPSTFQAKPRARQTPHPPNAAGATRCTLYRLIYCNL